MQSKLNHLRAILKEMDGAVIAFSGGVDSSLLAKVAFDQLHERAIAVTGVSDTYKKSEYEAAKRTADAIGIRHEVVATEELGNPMFAQNPANRCFYCKHELFSVLLRYAKENGIPFVLEGSNRDDTSDHRPGMKAAKMLNIRQPLIEADLGKDEIRSLAKSLGLKNWDKPASPCLSSRFPYGEAITTEKLRQVESGEAILIERGFDIFRVRHHGTIARIEVPGEDFDKLMGQSEEIVAELKSLGFKYVTLDLQEFRSGSLNDVLQGKGGDE